MKVSYADLKLETKEGAHALYWRLKQASKQVCDVRGLKVEGSLKRIREMRQCYRETLTAAVEKIDNELVTQIHNI
jgi:UrcA family protein